MDKDKGLMEIVQLSEGSALIKKSDANYLGFASPALKFPIYSNGLGDRFETIYKCLSDIEQDKAIHQAVCGLWGETQGIYVRVNTSASVNIEEDGSYDLPDDQGRFRMKTSMDTKDWLTNKSLVLFLNKQGKGKIGFARMSNYEMEPGIVEWYIPDRNSKELLQPLSTACDMDQTVWSDPKTLAALLLAGSTRVQVSPKKDYASKIDLRPLYLAKRKWYRSFDDYGTEGVESIFEAEDLAILYRSTIRQWAKDEIDKFNGNGPMVGRWPLEWMPGVSVQFKGRYFPKHPLTKHKLEKTVGVSL